MHTATLTRPLQWGNQPLDAGTYLVEDHNAAEMLHAGRGCGDVTLAHHDPPAALADFWRRAPEINVVRVGGFGDLLWCNAVYAEMKRQRPDLRIRHACFPRYAAILDGFVDEVLPYPFPHYSTTPSLHPCSIYWLENIIEAEPCLDGEHPCDRIAARFGLDPLPRKSAYHLTAKEAKKGLRRWPRHPKSRRPRVCLQVESSTGNKSYPWMQELFGALIKSGYEVLVVGDPSPRDQPQPAGVFNARKVGLGIRESIAMASHCDVIIGSDSVFVHVGAALDIPVVGIFGPFHGASYMAGQRGTALQGRKKCSPCSWHPRGTPFPPDQWCSRSLICESLYHLPVPAVLEAVAKWV